MKYDVTIGMPIYKSRPYIERAMLSALDQTYPSIEFLLVDDAGDDGSIDVILQLKSQHPRGKDIRVISHDKNQGVSFSRNEIIENAQGTYLFFMDSDDEIRDNTIDLLMSQATKYEADFVIGSYEKIDLGGKRIQYRYPKLQLLQKDQLASYAYRKYGGIQASACNYLVKIALLRSHKHFFVNANYWEDFVFTFDLVTLIDRAVLLPDITYSYICRENSLSHYQQRDKILKDEIAKNVQTIEQLKKTSSLLYNKTYYPNRCYNIVMTDFYIACNILRRRNDIRPFIYNKDIKNIMRHPATWCQICHFNNSRFKNMLFFLLGKMPSSMCVLIIWGLGKIKKLV